MNEELEMHGTVERPDNRNLHPVIGQHLVSHPYVVHVGYGDHTGNIVKRQQFNFDDVGMAHARMNEALGWRAVKEVELVVVLKRVRVPPKKG